MNEGKTNALDWVTKEYLTPIELEALKGANTNIVVILGSIKEKERDNYTERYVAVQFVHNKKVRWLKLRVSVLKTLIRTFGEYVEDWTGKQVRLVSEEERGFEVVGVVV